MTLRSLFALALVVLATTYTAEAQSIYVRPTDGGRFSVRPAAYSTYDDPQRTRRAVEPGDQVQVDRAVVQLCIEGGGCGSPLALGEHTVAPRSRSRFARAAAYVGRVLSFMAWRGTGPVRTPEPLASRVRSSALADSAAALPPVLLFANPSAPVRPGPLRIVWVPPVVATGEHEPTVSVHIEADDGVVWQATVQGTARADTDVVLDQTSPSRYCVTLSSDVGGDHACFRTPTPAEAAALDAALDEVEAHLGPAGLQSLEAVAALAEAGFVYDAFVLLDDLIVAQPFDPALRQAWGALLASVTEP